MIHEKADEEFRIRKCVVYFYLEDDSIQVTEPQVENSGIPQGTGATCLEAQNAMTLILSAPQVL